jgi:Ca2+-transporting ATPase
MIEKAWRFETPEQVFAAADSHPAGLSAAEVAARQKRYGPNKLPEQKGRSLFTIFIDQFKSPLIYVLIAADAIVFLLREYTDGFIILFILLFNAVLGTIQEGRAQNTLAALTRFVETRAEVLREGREVNLPDTEVVPGDVILLQEGERVPADARLIEVRSLKAQEAALTGESEPVTKIDRAIPADTLPTAEQKNMVFKGTTVAVGAARAVVTATGIETVIGRISKSIAGIETEIPLTANLKRLAKLVVYIVLALIVLIFILGILDNTPLKEMFVTAVAISVAAVPEGLPLVLTVTLAAGVWRMAKRRVLVKKLQAVESLGQAHEIAVDKTGTITKNELVVQKVVTAERTFDIAGVGYEPVPRIPDPDPAIRTIARIAALCSNARVLPNDTEGGYRLIGDPTEGAMHTFAAKAGMPKEELLKTRELVTDWPFDYQKKLHLALFREGGVLIAAVSGAPEVILKHCDTIANASGTQPLTEEVRKAMESNFYALSKEGLRVIACAHLEHAPANVNPDNLPPLTFAGLLAMRDALREGIREKVERAADAGIKVTMITGDHAITAKTLATQAGIYHEGDDLLTGTDLDTLPAEELARRIPQTSVFARVTPEHKMKIIQERRNRGEVIAMTGDGVNDAPSLVAADLGIAMGKIGTEVAKEASDLVLMDDNFGDILNAVEEGRNMRQGLRHTITYLFSSNLGEIILIITALIVKLPLPLLAAQIIWMNVVTDTFFDISLALEPKNPELMKKHANVRRSLFDRLTAVRLLVIAPIIAFGSFWLFQSEIADPVRARTFALTSLVVFQWFNSMNCRSEEKSIFTMNPFSNKFLAGTLVWVIVLHSFAVYNPFMNDVLRISPLSPMDWLRILGVGIFVVIGEEIRKFFYRRKLASPARATA